MDVPDKLSLALGFEDCRDPGGVYEVSAVVVLTNRTPLQEDLPGEVKQAAW